MSKSRIVTYGLAALLCGSMAGYALGTVVRNLVYPPTVSVVEPTPMGLPTITPVDTPADPPVVKDETAPTHKPMTLDEVRAAIAEILSKHFGEGDYHIEVSWVTVEPGGLVRLLIVLKSDMEKEKEAEEDGSGYTPQEQIPGWPEKH